VYQAVEAGKFTEAQGMMSQVLRDHPNSAKAHFVEAEILAKQGRSESAQAELNTAERLSPGLAFAKPGAVQSLKAHIAGSHGVHTLQSQAESQTPWGTLLLIGLGMAAFIFFVTRWLGRRNAIPTGTGPRQQFGSGPSMQPYGAGGVGPTGPAGGGMGSGIMGSLATGAAIGAGVVAGEALMHHFTDGNRHTAIDTPSTREDWASAGDDLGGNDFGIADNASWDDNPIGGGDDWS